MASSTSIFVSCFLKLIDEIDKILSELPPHVSLPPPRCPMEKRKESACYDNLPWVLSFEWDTLPPEHEVITYYPPYCVVLWPQDSIEKPKEPASYNTLPTELQSMIWDTVLSETHQVIQFTLSRGAGWRSEKYFSYSRTLSPILSVCHLSRERAIKHYTERSMQHVQYWSEGVDDLVKVFERLPSEMSKLTEDEDKVVGQWWSPEHDYIFFQEKLLRSACPHKHCLRPSLICTAREPPVRIRQFDPKIRYAAILLKDWVQKLGQFPWLLHCFGLEYIFVIADREHWPKISRTLHRWRFANGPLWIAQWMDDEEWERQKEELHRFSCRRLGELAVSLGNLLDRRAGGISSFDHTLSISNDHAQRIKNLKVHIVDTEEEITSAIAVLAKTKAALTETP